MEDHTNQVVLGDTIINDVHQEHLEDLMLDITVSLNTSPCVLTFLCGQVTRDTNQSDQVTFIINSDPHFWAWKIFYFSYDTA